MRWAIAVALLLVILPAAPAPADPGPEDASLAVGLKAGLLPPLFGLVEVVGRPLPHLGLGLAGVIAPGDITGKSGLRWTVSPEVMFEARPGRSTYYAEVAYVIYRASGPGDWFEHFQSLRLVPLGYEWRWPAVELQVGVGAQVIVQDDVPPCTGWCIDFDIPVIPDVEVGVRYRF